jgi:catechol 2,3-dioxygenase-like lactoylglutathione lyase family enzyme
MTLLAPVLSVDDPAAALAWFAALPGLAVDTASGQLTLGPDRIIITQKFNQTKDLRPISLDHVALRVGSLDAPLAAMLARGAVLHAGYTPHGPRSIAAFWDSGVRFAFLRGPGGVPVELCERLGPPSPPTVTGIDHLGLRCANVAATAAELSGPGMERLARHSLDGGVEVEFLRQGGLVWELFDEAAQPETVPASGLWSGVAPVADQPITP